MVEGKIVFFFLFVILALIIVIVHTKKYTEQSKMNKSLIKTRKTRKKIQQYFSANMVKRFGIN